jgi:cytochrome c2
MLDQCPLQSQQLLNHNNLNTQFKRFSLALLLLINLSSISQAESIPQAAPEFAPARPIVAGFERFSATHTPANTADDDSDAETTTNLPTTPELGLLLLGELNCTSCHSATDHAKDWILPKEAPVLTDATRRLQPAWIEAYLASPQQVKPGTTMPHLLDKLPPAERQTAARDLIAYLSTNGTLDPSYPTPRPKAQALATFQQVGCAACHTPPGSDIPPIPTSIPLVGIEKKYTADTLRRFLQDPLHSRPAGRMPKLQLEDDQLTFIVSLFFSSTDSKPNLRYQLYQGSWESLPNFNRLTPEKTGECAGFDLTIADRHSDYGLRFEGYFYAPKAGPYRFRLGSDDGATLIVNNEEVINVDGRHPVITDEQTIELGEGIHQVIVNYFQAGGGADLIGQVTYPSGETSSLAGSLLLKPERPKPVAALATNGGSATRGAQLYSSLGCASCHKFDEDGQRQGTPWVAPPLTQLNPAKGCLDQITSLAVPGYALSTPQVAAITAALTSLSEKSASTAHDRIRQKLLTFNCYACHSHDDVGGVEAARNAWFETTMKEMGDEGRLPPALTGVGDKLQEHWLRHVLNSGEKVRGNYMLAKMPVYGESNLGSLPADLITADRRDSPELFATEFPEPTYKIKAAGRALVGGKALSCIKCHDFAEHASTGIRALSLTSMTNRLREDWFVRYLADPQAYRRGTRMPAAWPFGVSSIPQVLDANTNWQIRSVWTYLSDGERAAIPQGLVREPIELKPTDTPIIYRNFLDHGGSRAIAVGYPQGLNIMFDAETNRLAAMWQGQFIDASRHWNGRGQGFVAPLGDNLLVLSGAVPFASLSSADAPWPDESAKDQGYQFQGYRLNDKQEPTFRYRWHQLQVLDQFIPTSITPGEQAKLTRQLSFEGTLPSSSAHFKAATANSIEPTADGFLIDGVWKILLEGPSAKSATIRQHGPHKELLVPLNSPTKPEQPPTSLKLHYVW